MNDNEDMKLLWLRGRGPRGDSGAPTPIPPRFDEPGGLRDQRKNPPPEVAHRGAALCRSMMGTAVKDSTEEDTIPEPPF